MTSTTTTVEELQLQPKKRKVEKIVRHTVYAAPSQPCGRGAYVWERIVCTRCDVPNNCLRVCLDASGDGEYSVPICLDCLDDMSRDYDAQ